MPSASVWRIPKGPQRCGPMRLCMSQMALRSNQIISMTETSSAANATSTLIATMASSAQCVPFVKSGSPVASSPVIVTPS